MCDGFVVCAVVVVAVLVVVAADGWGVSSRSEPSVASSETEAGVEYFYNTCRDTLHIYSALPGVNSNNIFLNNVKYE